MKPKDSEKRLLSQKATQKRANDGSKSERLTSSERKVRMPVIKQKKEETRKQK